MGATMMQTQTPVLATRPTEKIQWQRWFYKIKRGILLAFAHAFCLSVAAGCLFPLVWMLSSSLKTQSTIFSDMRLWVTHPHWENYYNAWPTGHFGQYFFNSLFYTFTVVAGVIVFASLAAY